MTVDEMFGDDDVPPGFEAIQKMFGKQEPLHPDLVPHLTTGSLGPMLHHPLVINVIHHDMQNGFTNKQYLAKKAAVEEAEDEGNWSRYIFMHERPYRFDALMQAAKQGLARDPKQYWDMVGSVWVDSENIHESFSAWHRLWSAPMPGRENCMNEDEQAALAALPDTITVYRGVGHAAARRGLSWTTDKARAEWFANRFSGHRGRRPHVYQGTVAKKDVLAHFLGRNESEIVALPENVRNQKKI
jgi:hypothetical protein